MNYEFFRNFVAMNETVIKKREFTTSFHEEDGVYVMHLIGWLDTSATDKAKKELEPLRNHLDGRIVIDLTELRYISSSGLRLLLALLKDSSAKGGSMSVTGLSDYLHKVFVETGFVRLFNII